MIKAKDNSVGKSTLLKLPLWALGCEPTLDKTWQNLDCKVILEFSIEGQLFEVHRYKDIIHFREIDGQFKKYTRITGAYSEMLAELLDFEMLLQKRNSLELETPPPAYYFLPFYTDQKKSWSNAWDSFENLGQYENWKGKIIKYHTGLLPHAYLKIEKEISKNRIEEEEINDQLEKLAIGSEIVNEFVPNSAAHLSEEEFRHTFQEIKSELSNLVEEEESIFEEISTNESERAFLKQQERLSEKIIEELDADYRYAVENLIEDTIQCPLCGDLHENSVVNRAGILTNKQQAEQQLAEVRINIKKIEGKIDQVRGKLHSIKEKISSIYIKYGINTKNASNLDELANIIESFAANSLKGKIQNECDQKAGKKLKVEEKIKELKKEQRELTTKELEEKIETSFKDHLTRLVRKLDAEGINLSEINSPLNYKAVVKEGGAAEGSRAILAYYLSIYFLIKEYGQETIAPLMIDTPNQQEQSKENYERIVDLILEDLSDDSQVILCAMDHPTLKRLEENSHVISLDEDQLLQKNMYDSLSRYFKSVH